MKRHHRLLYTLSCIALTASCVSSNNLFDPKKHDLHDQELSLSRDDYYHVTDEPDILKTGGKPGDPKATATLMEPPVPDLATILAAPKPPKIGETQQVSIAVTDDVPLKDVFIELARLANVDIEVDSSISGGVNFRAKDRPFNEVIDRICDMANLRYTMKDNVVRVERDTPYVQVYPLDFLNLERTASSSANISTSVLSSGAGSGGGGGGLTNGSSSTVTSKADSDFWKQFEESVKQIIDHKEPVRVSNVSIAEQPSLPAAPAVAAPASAVGLPAAGGLPGAAGASTTPMPAAPAPRAPAPAAAAGSDKNDSGSFYILNREASTLTIAATEKQHDLLRRFIKTIQANISSQVLIEAKIVEVTLNDEYQSGINWSKIGGNQNFFNGNFTAAGTNVSGGIGSFTFNQGNLGIKNFDLNAVVQLAQAFGTTRTLASPRLSATNNQEAEMTFAENQVYFTLTVTQSQGAAPAGATTGINTVTVTSTAHTVPIGIIMSLQPSINRETNEVTLNIRPTLSRITGQVVDPAVAFVLAQLKAQGVDTSAINSTFPVIEVREMDSLVKVKSGQVMVIGGLMQDVANNNENGLPGVAAIPWVGNLFKGVDKKNTVSELVIFIRATIIDSSGGVSPGDKAFYEKFTRDPRPLTF